MREDNKIRKTIKITKLIEAFCQKYSELINFIPHTEIELMFMQAVDELPDVVDFNPDFQISYMVERKFFLKARDEINAGNIDLEILIVEKHLAISKFLLRQLKYKGENIDSVAEEGIINCIENYDGQDNFKNSILKHLRNLIALVKVESPKEKEEDKTVQEEVSDDCVVDSSIVEDSVTIESPIIDETLEPQLNTMENTLEPVVAPISIESQLVIPNDGVIRRPNQLELLMNRIDILHQIPIEDEKYIKFIFLKYGYHQNQYFDLGEIAEILEIPLAEVIQYYVKSLEYVKGWFGLQLDKMYTYYIQKSE